MEDFLINVNDKWYATYTLGVEFITEYNTMSPDKKQEVFTKKWWSKFRFQRFGNQLKEKLQDGVKKKQLRNLFKSDHDKLSYYSFFIFIEGE